MRPSGWSETGHAERNTGTAVSGALQGTTMKAKQAIRRTWRLLAVGLLPIGAPLLCASVPTASLSATEGQGGGAQPTSKIESPAVAPRHPLADVASIFEATVSSTYEKYDPELGPRTYFVLSDMVTHAGVTPDSNEFSHLGGKTPSGEEMVVFDLPEVLQGKRYLFFVSARASLYTPIWAGLLFSVQDTPSGSFVVGPTGRVVTGASKAGVAFGESLPNAPAAPPPNAMQKSDFVLAMAHAASEVGAPFEAPVSLKPEPGLSWKVAQTSPVATE